MLDNFRTILAKLIVQDFSRPCDSVVAAYLWLAAEAEELEEKRRCLRQVLELDPTNEAPILTPLLLEQSSPTG